MADDLKAVVASKIGDTRVMNGRVWQLYEIELEGEKWMDIGPAPTMPADTPMVLVPREPTEAMVGAALPYCHADRPNRARDIYRAMLSASPVGEGASASPIPTEQAGGAVVGWQPIETAPKDGTPILITRPTDFDREERFHVVRWAEHPHFDDDECWVVHDGKNDHPLRGPDPTEWSALSAPSTTSTAEQAGEGEAPVAWRSMESAPKTPADTLIARPFLGWCPDETAPAGGDIRVCWWEPKVRGGCWWSDRDLPEDPVLWRSLPDAPGVSRPTPATPEGLREAVRKVRLWVKCGMPDQSDDTPRRDALRRDLQAILSALQPQAQPAALSPETDQ